jgi:hypothetical protein
LLLAALCAILPSGKGDPRIVHWVTVTGLLAAVVAVVSWLGVEWYRFWRGRGFISSRQLALRTVMATLIGAVVGMIFWGSYHSWQDPLAALTYWSACLALLIAIILLTLRDWRMLMREQHLRRAQLYRRMDEELNSLTQREREKDD